MKFEFTDPQIKLLRKLMNSSNFGNRTIRFMKLEDHLKNFYQQKKNDFIETLNDRDPTSFNNWMVKFSNNYKVKRSFTKYTEDEIKFIYIVCRYGLEEYFIDEKREIGILRRIVEKILTFQIQ